MKLIVSIEDDGDGWFTAKIITKGVSAVGESRYEALAALADAWEQHDEMNDWREGEVAW